jgi:flagellar M-ring protein FliF
LDDDQVDTIRYFVAGAVAEMKPENVTVTDGNGYSYPGTEANRGPNEPYARAVRNYEKDLNAKIRTAITYIPNMTVTSTITLDHDTGSHSVDIKNDPKPVPVQTSEDTVNTTHDAGSTGGAPGFPQGGANAAASIKGTETSETSKNRQVNVVSSTSTVRETAGLTPKTAKVTIGIPASYYEKVWARDNPPEEGKEGKKPKPEDLKTIAEKITQEVRAAAANLLPIGPEIKDPTSLVTVSTFQDIKSAAILGPPVTERAMSWLSQNWPMAAMVGLVLFSLNVLRSLLRSVPATVQSTPPATLSTRVSAAGSKSEESGDSAEVTAARRLRRISGSGPSLRDELSEFVKEDPDSAANILRTWIGQVT